MPPQQDHGVVRYRHADDVIVGPRHVGHLLSDEYGVQSSWPAVVWAARVVLSYIAFCGPSCHGGVGGAAQMSSLKSPMMIS